MSNQQRKGQKLLNAIYDKVPPHEAPRLLTDIFWQQKCVALERYIWNMTDAEFEGALAK